MKRAIAWHPFATPVFVALYISQALAGSCCLMPNYETTFPTGPHVGPASLFVQEAEYVSGSTTILFNNRHVMEDDGTGATPYDNCHFTGSAIPPQLTVSGGDWFVDGYDAFVTDYWGWDAVGWKANVQPQPVPYYRLYGPQNNVTMPCPTAAVQALLLFCEVDSTWWEYRDRNVLTKWIAATTVTNCRTDISSNACDTFTYP